MIDAVVYTSNTGYTKQYAELLSKRLSLPVYSLKDAPSELKDGSEIIYPAGLWRARLWVAPKR